MSLPPEEEKPPVQDRFVIRVYRPEDHDAVVALNAYGLAAAGVPAEADVYVGDLDDVAGTYLVGRSTLIVGELAGRVVAMGALQEVNEQTCEITRMRVDPGVQGRGFGKMILAEIEARATKFGFQEAVLLTGPNQHPAVDLYRGAGYRLVSFENHGEIAGVRMGKSLL